MELRKRRGLGSVWFNFGQFGMVKNTYSEIMFKEGLSYIASKKNPLKIYNKLWSIINNKFTFK